MELPAAVRSAFGTQLGAYVANGVPVYANISPAQVPGQLDGIVSAVLGLNNAAKMSVPLARNAVALPNFPGSYRPNDLLKAYDAGSTPAGSKTSIAIFAEGDVTEVVKDLRLAEKNNGLPQVPVKIVQAGLASPDTAGADEKSQSQTLAERRIATDACGNGDPPRRAGSTPQCCGDRHGDVRTDIITPLAMPEENRGRVLINLHGGGFVSDSGSLIEGIPIANLTKIRVVSAGTGEPFSGRGG
jgi:hypothetical protein